LATNPYFNFYTEYKEQNLVEDLIIEVIQIHGLDMVYLPRQFRNKDLVYGEDPVSKFTKSYDLEMMIRTIDGWVGDGEFLSKFGLEIREQGTFTVSQKRFHEVVGDERIRPNEGDLIWLPMNGNLFEIRFNEPKSVFYQLGELYVYDLNVEVYDFSHEQFDTKIPEIDSIGIEYANTTALELDTGTGTFETGEIVFQGPDLANATAKAEVIIFDSSTNTLLLTKQTGKFITTQNVFGVTSGASWFISKVDNMNNPADQIDDSRRVQNEAEDIIDFDEDNPFSEDM